MQWVNAGVNSLNAILIVVTIILAGVIIGQLSKHHTPTPTATPTSTTPSTTVVTTAGSKPTEYRCIAARARPGSLPAYKAKTWFLLGDEFAAGQGSSAPSQNSYQALLEAMARDQTGYDPTIINAVGANPLNLPEQIRLLRQSSSFRAVVAANEPILLLFSYGAGWLSSQWQTTGDASVYSLIDQIHMLAGGNASLIGSDIATHFQVVVMSRPDPARGGVAVPEQYAVCSAEPSLNRPSVHSRMAHSQIVTDASLILKQYAIKQGYAFVDVDEALGHYSLAQKRWDSDATAFRDCSTYNDLGHSFLADLVWQCMGNRSYVIPVKQ